jgi:N-sulfoglucosamine sulfohydrolase
LRPSIFSTNRFLLKQLFASLPLLLFAGCEDTGVNKPKQERRPNILFVLADDQSWLDVSAMGSKIASTPAFDRVAREGVLMTHSFATCPSCTPSRSSILTGRHIWQIEEAGVLYGSIPAKYPLCSHLLLDAGYHVGYTGKGWGPGDWRAGGLTRNPLGVEYNQQRMKTPVPAGIDGRDYTANFEVFLQDRPEGAPFFFWFGATEPHRVYAPGIGLKSGKLLSDVTVPAFWPDTDAVRGDILDYAVEIEWMDNHLQQMLAKLEAMGELENTLIVVTSDNGMPFPRAKVNLNDWGVRMPLAIRWGSKITGSRVVDDFTSHIDLAPTFLEAAGIVPPEEMTGKSLLPVLKSDASGIVDSSRDRAYFALERHTWCRPEGAAYPIRGMRTRDHLYLKNYQPDRWPTGGPTFVSSNKTFHGDVDGCPTKDFMLAPENQQRYSREFALCFGKRPEEEVYDVRKDPDQIDNLAGQAEFQSVKNRLGAELETFLKKTGDPRMEGKDPWQQYVYHQTVGFGATFNRSLSEEERKEALERAAHKPE